MAEGFAEKMSIFRSSYIIPAALPVLLASFLLAPFTAAGAVLTEEQKGQTISALEAAAASPSPEMTTALYEKISRADVSAEEWAPAFREYLDKNHFSYALGGAWRDMVGNDGPGQEPAARAAGAFAAAALQSVLHNTPPNLQELDTVLQWLEQCTAFAPPLAATIGTGLDAVLRNRTLDSALLGERAPAPVATPAMGAGAAAGAPPTPETPISVPGAAAPGVSPSPSAAAALPALPEAPTAGAVSAPVSAATAPPTGVPAPPSSKPAESAPAAAASPPTTIPAPAFPQKTDNAADNDKPRKADTTPIPAAAFPAPAMQVAITLGYYAGPENIGRWMRLPEVSLGIYRASGVWVFDGGALSSPQAQSLGSLLSAMPTTLTGVSVISMMVLPFSLRAPGLVLPIAPVSPELQRPPVVLPPGAMLPSIPEFTATVARALGEIIQQRELARRPELAKRRDILLLTAEGRANSVLSAFLAPGGYAGPNDFFPSLTVLWLAGSETALQAAEATIDQGEYEGMYALLLLADLFSGGGDTTLILATNPAGQVMGSETALRRNYVAPGLAYVTGVAAGGRMFFFDGLEYETLAQF